MPALSSGRYAPPSARFRRSDSGFNGPRHLCRGIDLACRRNSTSITALQWGHGISAVESVSMPASKSGSHSASMGPRHLCRGITGATGITAISGTRFNGATASLPWNRRKRIGCSVPDSSLQWGHGISAVESCMAEDRVRRGDRASMGPRHLCRGINPFRGRPCLSIPASMGPRHLCRGITINAQPWQDPRASFNGATASLPWNQLPEQPHRQRSF